MIQSVFVILRGKKIFVGITVFLIKSLTQFLKLLKCLKQNINFQETSFLGALIIDLESFSFSENYLKREELLNQFRGKYQDLLNIFRN